MTLYAKILTVTLLPLILFLGAGVWQIQTTAEKYAASLDHHYETQAESVKKSIIQTISQMEIAASVLSESEDISNALQRVDNERLFNISRNFINTIDSVVFADPTGMVISRAPDEYRFGDRISSKKYFAMSMRNGQFGGAEQIDGKMSFVFSKSIKQYNDIDVGIVCIGVHITPDLLNSFANSTDLSVEFVHDDVSINGAGLEEINIVHQLSLPELFDNPANGNISFNLHFSENENYSELLTVRKYLYGGTLLLAIILIGGLVVLLNSQLKPYSKIVELMSRYTGSEIDTDSLKSHLLTIKRSTGEPIARFIESLVTMLEVIGGNFKQIEKSNFELEQINSQLSREVREKKQSGNINKVLFAISNAVNISTDLDDLYPKIHHHVAQVIDVTNFFIAIVNQKKQTLYFPYFVDTVDEDFSPITDFDPEDSLTGYVVVNRKPLLLKKKDLEQLAGQDGVWGPVPVIWMGVPLVVKNEIIGVMAVQSYTDPHLYTEKDLEVLVSISDQMAIALDRKATEDELVKSEKKYRSMMESFADPLYICSPDCRIEYMNPAMVTRIGRDATGESCYKSIHGGTSTCEWCAFDRINDRSIVTADIISPLDNRNYRLTSMPIQNSDGIISKMTIFHDTTDYMQAVREKEKAQGQLLQSQKMESIGTLAGGIAHDFNNILSSIIGFTELAREDALKGSEQDESLHEVYTASMRAKDLVQQILAFARQTKEETRPVRLSDVVTEVLRLLRPSTPANIDINTLLETRKSVIGNTSQLHQVVMNLCTNAIYSLEGEGGALEISLKNISVETKQNFEAPGLTAGEYVELTVTDNGPGIDPSVIDNIFEPYFTTKGVGEGTGMGLAMVRGIIESYGGDIQAKSVQGRETVFSIRLPVAITGEVELVTRDKSIAKGTERILLVDDEPPIARLGSRMLIGLGYSVTERTSSTEALELFKNRYDDFDLVITDMTMPDMTGDILAQKMQQIRANIPVILCTGYSSRMTDQQARGIGIKALVNKPFTKSDFAGTIREVLDNC